LKKYKWTLLIGTLITVFLIQISKPNSGLDNDQLFALLEDKSTKIDNYIQKNNFTISKSEVEEKMKKEEDSFFKSYIDNLFNIEKEEKEEEKPAPPLERYKHGQRMEIMYKDDSSKNYFLTDSYSLNNDLFVNYIKNIDNDIVISENNIVDDEGIIESFNPFEKYYGKTTELVDYKDLIKLLRGFSTFVEVNEIDENYVFKEEFNSIDNNVKTVVEDLKINDYIDESGILSYKDIIETKWDNEHVLINYNVLSNDLYANKFIFALTLEKGNDKFSIRFEIDSEQFNILKEFGIPKELQ